MEKGEGDNGPDDGIVSEDLTSLVEHIELTSPHRLPEAARLGTRDSRRRSRRCPDPHRRGGRRRSRISTAWTSATTPSSTPRPRPTSTSCCRRERRRTDQAAALAAERARWQKRIEISMRALAERDQLLAERERRIEELQARLATRTLEREGLADRAARIAPAQRRRDRCRCRRSSRPRDGWPSYPEVDFTLELPAPELPPVMPAVAGDAAPAPLPDRPRPRRLRARDRRAGASTSAAPATTTCASSTRP